MIASAWKGSPLSSSGAVHAGHVEKQMSRCMLALVRVRARARARAGAGARARARARARAEAGTRVRVRVRSRVRAARSPWSPSAAGAR